MSTHLIFVYGTLKRGQPNHEKMINVDNGQATFVGEARTVEKYPLIVASKFNVPFMLDKAGLGHHVVGEIYSINDKTQQFLDRFEHHPKLYRRKLISVATASGNQNIKDGSQDNIQECFSYLVENYNDGTLIIAFEEEYNAYGKPEHAYIPREKRQMKIDEMVDYLITVTQKH